MKKLGKIFTVSPGFKPTYFMTLLCLFAGCIKDDCPISKTDFQTIQLIPIWGQNIKKPEGIRITYYSLENNKFIQENIANTGGTTNIRKGKYRMFMYNNDSEKIRFRNISSYDTHEAYTGKINRPSYDNPVPGEETFDQPDILWLGKIETFQITDETQKIFFNPVQVVKRYKGVIQVEGMENVQSIRGAMTGMMTAFRLNGREEEEKAGTVFFDASPSQNGTTFSFLSFGVFKGDEEGKSLKHYLTLEFLLPNGIVTRTFDVTHQMDSISQGGLLDIDETIVLPPDTTGNNNGFNGNVNDWDEIYYPIDL